MPEKTERTFGQEFAREAAKEVTGRAIIWGPAIAGGLLLGPVGIFLGLVTSVAIVTSCCSDD